MDNKKILERVVLKAQKAGYVVPSSGILWDIFEAHQYDMTIVPLVIFSHDFASAFWGEESVWSDNGESSAYISRRKEVSCLYSWQYHLSKMVLYKEPLEYLEKFL